MRHKVNSVPVDTAMASRYPHQVWSIANKKGYCACIFKFFSTFQTLNCVVAGTAILSKQKPLSSTQTLPGYPDATAVKGRIVTLEFEKFYLIGTYVPNAGQGLKVPCHYFNHTV